MPSARCAGCAKFLSPLEAARCCTCNVLYHRACGALPLAGFIAPTWICPECKKKMHKGKVDGAHSEGRTSEESMDTSIQSCSTLDATEGLSADMAAVLRTFKDELHRELRSMFKEELRSELLIMCKDFQDELHKLRTDLAQLRVDKDQLKGSMEACLEKVNGIETRVGTLETKLAVFSEVTEEVSQLKRELNDRDQQLLINDVEISNLPETNGENLIHTVMLIGTTLGVNIEERDIVSAERVGGRHVNATNPTGGVETRPRSVAVRLARRDMRDKLIRAARVRRGTSTADLKMPGPALKFYVNERLTKHSRQLFRRARESAKCLGWQFVWTSYGRILVRQKPGDKAGLIRSESDLLRIFGPDAEKGTNN